MKALRLILIMALAATIPACNDENFDKEKCTITEFSNVGKMIVEQDSNIYQLYWEAPKIKTNRNNTTVIVTDDCEYEVCVLIVDNSNMGEYSNLEEYFPNIKCIPISKTTGVCARISSDEVIKALGDVKGFYFVVRLENVHARFADMMGMKEYDAFDGIFCVSEQLLVGNNSSQSHFWVLVSSSDDALGEVKGSGFYYYGEDVKLYATPKSDYQFVGWYDAATKELYSYKNPLQISVIDNVSLVAEFAKVNYTNLKPLQYENTDLYFNKWFTDGNKSIPLKIATNVAGEYSTAFAIEVLEEGDPWDNEFCCILRGNDGQAEDNKFTFDCEVYWERASDNSNDTAVIRLLTGKVGKYRLHDDWQWNKENTELITDNAGDFWVYDSADESFGHVFNLPRKIPNKEWTHVSWGDELKIGEKGAEYIGIQINLTNNDGTNNGIFYFRDIKISMGNTIYEIDYSDY